MPRTSKLVSIFILQQLASSTSVKPMAMNGKYPFYPEWKGFFTKTSSKNQSQKKIRKSKSGSIRDYQYEEKKASEFEKFDSSKPFFDDQDDSSRNASCRTPADLQPLQLGAPGSLLFSTSHWAGDPWIFCWFLLGFPKKNLGTTWWNTMEPNVANMHNFFEGLFFLDGFG